MRANIINKDDIVFHPIPSDTSLVIAMNKIGNTFKRIEISTQINIKMELCSKKNICPHFLLEMNSKMRQQIQSIVAHKMDGLSGHLVLFKIDKTLMYCFQTYPSERHSQMVWIENLLLNYYRL